jgi:competence CoiA-like predicted nuclease
MGFTKRNQKKFTKRNEILPLTKQNETKFRFFCFAEKDKVAEKMGIRHFPHFIHKFIKLFINFFYELFSKLPGKIGPVNIS